VHILYTPDISIHVSSYRLSREESKHAIRVLRLKKGEKVILVNGKGLRNEATVQEADPKSTLLSVETSSKADTRDSYKLHIAVAPTKNIDRIEWFLEKAIEIGIDEFTPLICHQSERKKVKMERLNRIAVSAMKQSQNSFLPVLNDPVAYGVFMNQIKGKTVFKGIAHCIASSEKKHIKDVLTAGTDAVLLIGPEGDFSEEEVRLALSQGFQPLSLGASRLRTETAALAACMEVAILNR